MLNHIINLSTLFAMIQGWASITDKIREFAFVLKGALVGNDFSCKVNQILRGMPPPPHEYVNCYKFWSNKVSVTHSQSMGQPITVHLNANAWL